MGERGEQSEKPESDNHQRRDRGGEDVGRGGNRKARPSSEDAHDVGQSRLILGAFPDEGPLDAAAPVEKERGGGDVVCEGHAEHPRDPPAPIRQKRERDVEVALQTGSFGGAVGRDGDDDDPSGQQVIVLSAELRKRLTAVRSPVPPVEEHEHRPGPDDVAQADRLPARRRQAEIRGCRPEGERPRHLFRLPHPSSTPRGVRSIRALVHLGTEGYVIAIARPTTPVARKKVDAVVARISIHRTPLKGP